MLMFGGLTNEEEEDPDDQQNRNIKIQASNSARQPVSSNKANAFTSLDGALHSCRPDHLDSGIEGFNDSNFRIKVNKNKRILEHLTKFS